MMTLPCLRFVPIEEHRMQLNGNQTSVRSDAIAAQLSSGAPGEIDLYEELLAFVEMTPEDKRRYLHPVDPGPSKEFARPSVAQVVESNPIDSDRLLSNDLAPEFDFVETDWNPSESAAVGGEFADLETASPFDDLSLDDDLVTAKSNVVDTLFDNSGPLADLDLDSDLSASESVAINHLSETSALFSDAGLASDPAAMGSPEIDLFENSEPTFSVRVDGDVGTAMPRGTCPACEAALAADELFCGECGNFLNGISSTSAPNQVCADCSENVLADELFCPWCGSVLFAA